MALWQLARQMDMELLGILEPTIRETQNLIEWQF